MTSPGPKRKVPLSPIDSAWLRMDRPTNLMVISAVMLFDEPLDFERLKATLRYRLLPFERFRQRAVESKLPPARLYWETDPHFDLNAHVRRLALPAPGDQTVLQETIGSLMSTRLDSSKPLWQVFLLENYGGGCAVLARLHHAIGDGVALAHVLLSLTDQQPDAPWPAPEAQPTPRLQWNPLAAIFGPAASALRNTRRLTETLLNEGVEALVDPTRALKLAKLGTRSAAAFSKLVLMLPDPKTIFKGRLGVAKRVAWSRPILLGEAKAIGHVTGGTVNDVLLTAVTGALRRYMLNRGERVDGISIRAVVPVNLRPLDEVPDLGNRFGLVFLSLPIELGDPIDRLAELKHRMDEIKDSPEAIVAFGILGSMGVAPIEVEKVIISIFDSKASAVMTNVPGPRETLYLAGAPIRSILFWVPQSGRIGLGVSILSYAGEVRLGIATDAGLVPDPQRIIDSFHDEFDGLMELVYLAETEGGT